MALRVASIYLTDSERKIDGSFGLHSNGFLDGLVSDIFPTVVLLNLRINKGP